MKFRFLEHTADVKFQSYGKTIEEAFENAALALIETITKGMKEKVQSKIKKNITIEGKDAVSLLYNFLEEFLFLLDAENFLLAKINKISILIDNDKTNKAGKHKLTLKVSKDNNKEGNKEQNNYNKKYKLNAEIIGDKAGNYKFTNDVKAVTYNSMFVKKEGKIYICQVVLDV